MANGESVFEFLADMSPAVTAVNQGAELINKAFFGMAKAAENAFNFAKQGEEILAVSKKFEAFISQAGLVPEAMAAGIEKAIAGTADMEDALNAASNSTIALGKNAARIPELFELAKKVTMSMGGDLVDNYQKLSTAIEFGNSKLLREFKIRLDVNKTVEEYAKSIGVSKDAIDESTKQFVIMNSVLEKGNKAFKNTEESILPLTEATKKSKVAFGELVDTASILFNKVFGTMMKTALNDAATSMEVLNIKIGKALLNQVPTATQQLKLLNDELQNAQRSMMGVATRGGDLEQAQKEIETIKMKIIAQESLIKKEQEIAAIKKNELDKQAEIEVAENARREQNRIFAEEEERKRQELRAKKLAEMQADADAIIKKEQEIKDALNIGNFAQSMATGFVDALRDMRGAASSLGKTMADMAVNGFGKAFNSMGKALANGENMLDAFTSSVMSTFGDMLTLLGQGFIKQGIAMMFSPGGQAAGAGLIAAGAALSVFGGFLSAKSGGSSSIGSSPTNPAFTSNTDYMSSTETKDEERMKATTGVNIYVQGNILDRRETGLELAKIISESYDTNGTIIRGYA